MYLEENGISWKNHKKAVVKNWEEAIKKDRDKIYTREICDLFGSLSGILELHGAIIIREYPSGPSCLARMFDRERYVRNLVAEVKEVLRGIPELREVRVDSSRIEGSLASLFPSSFSVFIKEAGPESATPHAAEPPAEPDEADSKATDEQGIEPADTMDEGRWTMDVSMTEAQRILFQDANTILDMHTQGLTQEFVEGRAYDLTVDKKWKEEYPEQYEMIKEWWKTLRKLFPGCKFNNIRINRNGSNGLVKIESSIIPDYDSQNGRQSNGKIKIGSSSIVMTGSHDIGYRIFKVLNIAFAASNIPDNIESWNDNSRELVEFINTQHMLLTGTDEPYIKAKDIESIIQNKRRIKIYLPPIERQDFNKELELELAKEALRSV